MGHTHKKLRPSRDIERPTPEGLDLPFRVGVLGGVLGTSLALTLTEVHQTVVGSTNVQHKKTPLTIHVYLR
jgi:hypothetical protein